jgi:hypothetical protein
VKDTDDIFFKDDQGGEQQKAMFECARKILLAGAWLIEQGNGRVALLPYNYATGHWRCEFHPLGKPKKTAFKYSIANGSAYLSSHCGGSIRKDVSPEKLAQAIWVSVPDDMKNSCSGVASREVLDWIGELRRQLGLGLIPAAFGEYFGERTVWQLSDVGNHVDGLRMPAMPGYADPGKETSVLDEPFWRAAELRAKRLAKRPEFALPRSALEDGAHIYEIANRLRVDMAEVDSVEAMRLLKAAVGALHSTSLANARNLPEYCELEVSTHPASDQTVRRATRFLSMVHELHKAGYQRLRVACGWDIEGKVWRARLMPSSQVSDDGWSPNTATTWADYSTSNGKSYFGWSDAASDDARGLANKFINRFPELVRDASGQDWGYAGWFSMVLGEAEHGGLPAFFGGQGDEPSEMPPAPLDCASRIDQDFVSTTGFPLIANDELVISDLPTPGASYLDLVPFCLSFDGYKGGLLEIDDCWAIAEKAQRDGLSRCVMDALRTLAFIHQRKLKNDSDFVSIGADHPSMRAIGLAIEEIRRRLA